MDGIPLYIIPEQGVIGRMDYADINCSRAFRYVRYVGPSDARCNIAEIEFYGNKGAGDDSRLPQLTICLRSAFIPLTIKSLTTK